MARSPSTIGTTGMRNDAETNDIILLNHIKVKRTFDVQEERVRSTHIEKSNNEGPTPVNGMSAV